MSLNTPAGAVRMGAAFLDDVIPNWVNRIDLELLDIAGSDNCILGQLYDGNYYRGKDDLGLEPDTSDKFGFAGVTHASSLLTIEWKKLITERRAAPKPSQPEVVLNSEFLELLVNRMDEINDPDHTLEETVFVVNGVRIVLK